MSSQGGGICTLFVTGLPNDLLSREIHNLFRWFPGYENAVINHQKGDKKGIYVFATFTTKSHAFVAMEKLQGTIFDPEIPRTLSISFAKSNSRKRQREQGPSEFWHPENVKKRLKSEIRGPAPLSAGSLTTSLSAQPPTSYSKPSLPSSFPHPVKSSHSSSGLLPDPSYPLSHPLSSSPPYPVPYLPSSSSSSSSSHPPSHSPSYPSSSPASYRLPPSSSPPSPDSYPPSSPYPPSSHLSRSPYPSSRSPPDHHSPSSRHPYHSFDPPYDLPPSSSLSPLPGSSSYPRDTHYSQINRDYSSHLPITNF